MTIKICYQGTRLVYKGGAAENNGGSEYRLYNDRWTKAVLKGKYSGWDRYCKMNKWEMTNCKLEVTARNRTVTTFWA